MAGERHLEEVEGEPAEVEGTSGGWVVDPTALGLDAVELRARRTPRGH